MPLAQIVHGFATAGPSRKRVSLVPRVTSIEEYSGPLILWQRNGGIHYLKVVASAVSEKYAPCFSRSCRKLAIALNHAEYSFVHDDVATSNRITPAYLFRHARHVSSGLAS